MLKKFKQFSRQSQMSPNQQRTLPPLSNEQQSQQQHQQQKQIIQTAKKYAATNGITTENLNSIVITATNVGAITDYQQPSPPQPHQHQHQYQQNEFTNNNNSQMCSEKRTNDANNNINNLNTSHSHEQRNHLINKTIETNNVNKNSIQQQQQQQTGNCKSSQLKESHSALVKILESAPINNKLNSTATATVTQVVTQQLPQTLSPSTQQQQNYSNCATFSGNIVQKTTTSSSQSSASSSPSPVTLSKIDDSQSAVVAAVAMQFEPTTHQQNNNISSLPSTLLVNKWINQQQQQNTNNKSYHHHSYHRKRNKHLIDINTNCDNTNMDKNGDVGHWKMRLANGKCASPPKDDCNNSNSSASSNASEAEIVCPWKKTRIAREWNQSHKMDEGVMDHTMTVCNPITRNDATTITAITPPLNDNQMIDPTAATNNSNATTDTEMQQQQPQQNISEHNEKITFSMPTHDTPMNMDGICVDDIYAEVNDDADIDEDDDEDDDKSSMCECYRKASLASSASLATDTPMNSSSWRRTSKDSDSNESILNNSTDSGCDSDCPENISELCKQFDEHLSEQEVNVCIN